MLKRSPNGKSRKGKEVSKNNMIFDEVTGWGAE